MNVGWLDAKNVLSIRLDAMGDFLMTTPAIRALKESVPGRRVTALVSRSAAEAAAHAPEVDEVVVYDPPWMKATPRRADASTERAVAGLLSKMKFDAAVIFTVYSQNPLPAALMAFQAEIPLRLAHCRENPYQLLTDWVPEREPAELVRHEVRRQLDLVAAVGARTGNERLSLRLPDDAMERTGGMLDDAGIPENGPWVAIHPGASAPSRRYPEEAFAEAATAIASRDGWPIVFTGSAAEGALIDRIRRLMKGDSVSLAGKLSFIELACALSRASVLVSNNTGPAHIAAAVWTPVVDLYALTNPQHTPWLVPSRVLFQDVPCKFCYKSECPETHHACLREVPPSRVADAARELVLAENIQGETHAHAGDQRRLS